MRRRYNYNFDEVAEETVDNGPPSHKNNNYGISPFIAICFLLVLGGLYGLVYFIDSVLPTGLKVEDEKHNLESFIAERAQIDLKMLTDIGPRVTGSVENEVLAVAFLKQQVNNIVEIAHKNQKIELDVQLVTGSYFLDVKPVGPINIYANVQNVVVKVFSKNSTSSLLVNAHFDSVPTSPGGSDDGINCAAMLEILRKITSLPERPLHNIIFLFNGAEETPLQAAHGFITQHKWAEECKVIINLEAAGVGGKIILFQSGPARPWLMKYYGMVPHPYGQASGEEIFQSNLIPSDTDFRIFRDFGGLVGMDMAFIKNGYRYHTKYDNFEAIPLGSYQHVGDNALSLVKNIANAPELDDANPVVDKTVFFDVLGLFLVSYTSTSAIILNTVTAIFSIATFIYSAISFKLGFSKTLIKYLTKALGAILISWITALLFVFATAYLLDSLNYSMSWYANPWLVFGLYVSPTVALIGLFLLFVDYKKISIDIQTQIEGHIIKSIWTLLLIVGTIFKLRSVYALVPTVLMNSCAYFFIHLFKVERSIRKWQMIYVLSLIIPSMILMYQAHTTLGFFIPLTGRMGSDKPTEVIIGLMVAGFTILIISPYVALIKLIENMKYFFIPIGLLFLTTFIIVFTPLGFPYSAEGGNIAPQRHWLLHTGRVFHDANGSIVRTDSGILFVNLDRNSPKSVKSYIPDLSRATPLGEDCEKYVFCALPLVHSKVASIIQMSTWLPAGQPVITFPVTLNVTSKEKITPTLIRNNVTVTGPNRLSMAILPFANTRLVKLSLLDNITDSLFYFDERPVYYIWHTSGKKSANISFSFDIEVPENWDSPTVEMTVVGRYVNDKLNKKTPYYTKIINQFPKWADVTAWLGMYSFWIV